MKQRRRHRQNHLETLFAGESFGPRNGFIDHEWQSQCDSAYKDSVVAWRKAHEGNGGFGQHRFCIYAGTGAGKTKAAALLACFLLNKKWARQVVVVCPSRAIARKTRADFLHLFGIDLVLFSERYADGVPRGKHGYILTYGHLAVDAELHRFITQDETLVIFDEVHHLGDKRGAWGEAAKTAYAHVPFVLSLTGTPYRSDKQLIPFVSYEPTERNGIHHFKPDFSYLLGEAILAGVCRKPVFLFSRKETTVVNLRLGPNGGFKTVSFADDKLTPQESSLRLRGAVRFGAETRKQRLREALERCRAEQRKVIIFLGGDTRNKKKGGTPTDDALRLLPSELVELGYTDADFEVVVGDDKDALTKIKMFGESDKWILITVNMVSEGVDIPELSAAVFLTSVTAKQTTVQRIGRVLRINQNENDTRPCMSHPDALIFMFPDPSLIDVATKIDEEILAEEDRLGLKREPKPGEQGEPRFQAEAIGVRGGETGHVGFGKDLLPVETWEHARSELRAKGQVCSDFAVGLFLSQQAAFQGELGLSHVNG